MARKSLLALPAQALQHLGLLIALVLLVAATDFVAKRPASAAGLVFVFSLLYLVASISSKRAHFLYGTMLLGAVSYFLLCYALGAPAATFPLLSVPLVVCLWFTSQYLKTRLAEDMAAFPRTILRAMHITVAIFSVWALAQASDFIGQPGLLGYVAGLAFVGYACLYAVLCFAGAPIPYAYVFSTFAVAGGAFLGAAVGTVSFAWVLAMAASGAIFFVGTRCHRRHMCKRAQHFYLSGAAAIVVSLGLAVLSWQYFLLALALASLVLWLAYRWLAEIVGDVRQATTAERAAAKALFLSSVALAAPAALLIFIWPSNIGVCGAALAYGMLFTWVAWRRHDEWITGRNACVFPAVMFLSAGLVGILGRDAGAVMSWWPSMAGLLLLLALGALYRRLPAAHEASRACLAQGAMWPAFFAWFVPALGGNFGVAAASAGIALVVSAALSGRLKDRLFLCAIGPAAAGLFIAAVLSLDRGMPAWILCASAAGVAGICYSWADSQGQKIARRVAGLAWFILSGTAVIVAAHLGAADALCCVTAVGFISILMSGRRRRAQARDVIEFMIAAVAVLATIAAVALGQPSGLGFSAASMCLLALSAGHWLAWMFGRSVWHARTALALFALGLLVLLGTLSGVDVRLVAGLPIVLALFAAAYALRKESPQVAGSAVVVGHITAVALASLTLVQAWPMGKSYLPLACLLYVVVYTLAPWLRRNFGFRVGAAGWLSLLALFASVAYSNTPYREHVPLVATLSLVWLGLGFVLRQTQGKDWSLPLYTCATALAILCGTVSLFAPASTGSWPVFLANGIAFALLFLILRQDIFAYLLTLSLTLLAYDWVKISTSRFTQDVLFYLVIGTACVGVIFLLPHLKRLVGRLALAPLFSIFTVRGAALMCVPVGVVAVMVLSAYSLKITAHPRFCTSCHNMGEFYKSWQHSSHKDVACVECHYAPGLAAEMKGKLEGLVQVVKYVSHAYQGRPHALIENKSCMRTGCHADMDHNKETLLFKGKIKFRHEPHLSKHPRGKELNCVSCHGQTVQGQHIGVTKTTCLTCHFYGRKGNGVAAGKCRTCHAVPQKPVLFSGEEFSHTEFLEDKTDKNVRCTDCHSRVTEGSGEVSETRCRSCHNQKSKKQITDQAKFHLIHVSKGHFDCLQCHDEIKHGDLPMRQQMLVSGRCSACHVGIRHSVQEAIYAGTAVPGIKQTPGAMYVVGVACDGCHTDLQQTMIGQMAIRSKVSSAKQCVTCHNDDAYADDLKECQQETKARLAKIQQALAALTKTCETAKGPKEQIAKARQLLASAQAKVSPVVRDGSLGAHNADYVSAILDSAEADVEKCRTLVATWETPGHQEPKR